jgi:hypothetical protein
MELTDLALVTKTRLGDADAFRVLVERHSCYCDLPLYMDAIPQRC